jgi:murein L,D-transpeptidase YafK
MVSKSMVNKIVRFAAVVMSSVLLAGCENTGTSSEYKAFAPISADTLALMDEKGTEKNAPVLIRTFKKEAELEIWKQRKDGRYVLLSAFPICRWSGQLGPKIRDGDRQVPEGFYAITPGQMMPNSAYYLSFNIGFPNAFDRAWGHTGDSIMVHGVCSSAGCFSMTDKQIEQIYAIVREAFAGGQRAIQLQSLPFRMTAENLAKFRLDPNIAFWRELKHGSDHFEITKREPPVGVCDRHYAFATSKSGRFDALASCPPLNEDDQIENAVAAKDASDLTEIATLVSKGTKPIQLVYQDGGQNAAFANRFAEVSRPETLVNGPAEVVLDERARAKAALSTPAPAP